VVPSGLRQILNCVSIKQRYPGHARQAGMIASQCRSGAYLGRYVVVVDDDVDVTNSEEFLWVLSSRSIPPSRSKFFGAPGAAHSIRASRAIASATARADDRRDAAVRVAR
jgi:hypothetical protein